MGFSGLTNVANFQRWRNSQADPDPTPKKKGFWSGFLAPESYMGEDVDPGVARQARASALLNFGSALLEGAGSGDYSGSLARGLQGAGQAWHGTLSSGQQRARQQEIDEREARESEDRLKTSEHSRGLADEQLGFVREDRGVKNEEREATAERVRGLAQQVIDLDPESAEAKKARAYMEGGNAYLFEDEIGSLHEAAVKRSRFDGDFDRETDATIRRAKEESQHGFGPVAEGSRAERGLDLDAQRAVLYGEQVRKQLDRDPELKPGAWSDNVAVEAQRIMEDKISILKQRWNDGKARMDEKGNFIAPVPYTALDMARIRKEANEEAMANERRRLQSQGVNPPPGRYRYNPATGAMEPQ